ncbi:hypothetical protein HY631_00745 [Candidatus Uhrbacteria bacterium]|nr:hypothetical protein [Candidatus Uhrbacteria bacterium]
MKKIAVLFLGLAMGIANVGIPAAHAGSTATLSLSPTNTSVETGDSFSLSVLVDANDESLDTVRVDLSFNPALVEVLSFDLGSLFPNFSPSNDIDNDAGTLSYGAFKFGTPVTSAGTLATVTFHALSAGTATISVASTSRLIADGQETINTSSLGSARVTISGADVASEAPEEEEEEEEEASTGGTATSASAEAQALVYFGALFGRLPSSGADWTTNDCIADNGCYDADHRNLSYEVAAIARFNSKYGANPSSSMDWNAVHALAYTSAGQTLLGLAPLSEEEEEEAVEEEEVAEEEPAAEEEATEEESTLSLEQQGLVYFGAFYGRMPSSGDDWSALHCIAYGGCQGDPRDLQAEQDSLVIFGAKYAKMPSTSMEWNVIHTLAYTDFLDEGDEEEAVVEEVVEEAVPEEETELTLEQQAIGWFGKITGQLPSEDADWVAVDYMVNGFTPSEDERDLEAESAAITTFVGTFGYLPSSDQDWNIVAAIAYSGAF